MSRPSERPTGAVWRLLEEWSKEHELEPNQKQMAKMFGVSDSLVSNWKYMDSLMQPNDVNTVAQKTGIPVAELFAAAVEDAPIALQHAAERRTGQKASGQLERAAADEAGEPEPSDPDDMEPR